MSQHVVRNDLGIIYDKVGVSNRVELALWYEARVSWTDTQCSQRSHATRRRGGSSTFFASFSTASTAMPLT
jgi:hypothetical protein